LVPRALSFNLFTKKAKRWLDSSSIALDPAGSNFGSHCQVSKLYLFCLNFYQFELDWTLGSSRLVDYFLVLFFGYHYR